jgi:membrane protein
MVAGNHRGFHSSRSFSPRGGKWVRRFGETRDWLKDLYVSLDRTRTFGLAAETAFWLFLSLLPLLAIAGLVAARLSIENWQELTPIIESFPPAPREFVTSELLKVAEWDEGTVGLGGTITFLWLASSGVHAIFDALEIESGAERPWIRQRSLALATCFLLSISIAILAILGPGVEAVFSEIGRRAPLLAGVGELSWGGRLVRGAVGLGVLILQIYGLYWLGIPSRARKRMPLWPGAVVTGVLQLILSFGYGWYISTMGTGTAYTAGLTIVGLILTALYLFVVALLVGAAVNRKLGGFSGGRKHG